MRLGEIGDDYAVVPEQFVADGDTVVMLGTYNWKHKSTGEPAIVKMVHVWTMDGGKAVAFQQHVDTIRVRDSARPAPSPCPLATDRDRQALTDCVRACGRCGRAGVRACGRAGVRRKYAICDLSATYCDMRTLYLRNVPDVVVERLERLAARDATSVGAVAVRELAEVCAEQTIRHCSVPSLILMWMLRPSSATRVLNELKGDRG